MLSNLLRPFAYLTIRHPSNLPRWVNWAAPALVTFLVLISVGFGASGRVDVWGASGAVSRLLGFIQSLPGFYLAALAAIATFGSETMQQLMPGEPPTMNIRHNSGFVKKSPLTRRIFLSSMFAYLTGLSLLLTLAAIVGLSLAEPIKDAFPLYLHPWLKSVATFIYFLFVAQLLSITFWGLYYLGERLHLADS